MTDRAPGDVWLVPVVHNLDNNELIGGAIYLSRRCSLLAVHPKFDALRELGVKHSVTKPYTAETILRKLQEVLAEEPDVEA